MGRPGGNPGLKDYQFEQKYKWDEPCSEQLVVRVPPSMKAGLIKIDKWQELVRRAIAAELEKLSTENSPN
jgi:hypothetical protein